ncbi:hypothetical protein BC937DRAFT_92827 [Endogone sp. FLAS-F59071]|nr:hypothetical protein BC937DRAFT_92827 [Endogone sp. FLAS-F59071]|eukprot:RUS23068.1 hypothetical protein BC937DRAFT_92827 [Endogone sp. FLAS-F59071]
MAQPSLVYFGTISPHPQATAADAVECVRFQQKVVLSELRIVPKNLKPFRKVDHSGQTFPSQFTLELLVHTSPLQPPNPPAPSTAGADANNTNSTPKKRPTQQYLHAVNIQFDESKGFQAFDVGSGKEVFTRFIMIRGNYKHLTMCIYGAVLDGNSTAGTNNSINQAPVPRHVGNGSSTAITASITSKETLKIGSATTKPEKMKDETSEEKPKEHLQLPQIQTSPTTSSPSASTSLPIKSRDRTGSSRWGGPNIATTGGPDTHPLRDVPPTPTSASSAMSEAPHEVAPYLLTPSSSSQSQTRTAAVRGDDDYSRGSPARKSSEHSLSPTSPQMMQGRGQQLQAGAQSQQYREDDDQTMDEVGEHEVQGSDMIGEGEMDGVAMASAGGEEGVFGEATTTRRGSVVGVLDPLELRTWRDALGRAVEGTLLAYHSSPSATLLRVASSSRASKDAWDRLQRLASMVADFVGRHSDEDTGADATAADKMLLQRTLDDIAGCFVEGIVYAMRRVPPVNYGGDMDRIVAGVSWAMDMRSGKSSMKLLFSALVVVSLMCACGEDVAETVLARNIINRLASLLHIRHATSLLRLRVLSCLLECMDDPRVVERLLGWDLPSSASTSASLYQHILSLAETAPLPTRVATALKRVVRKASVYEACAIVQRLADERVERQATEATKAEACGSVALGKRRRVEEAAEMDIDGGGENSEALDSMNADVDPEEYHERERAAMRIVNEVGRCLKRVQKAVLAHHASVSAESTFSDGKSEDQPAVSSIVSFRHLTARRLFPSLTVLLASRLIHGSPRALAELTAATARFCATLAGTRHGMLYLAEQVWQRVGIDGVDGEEGADAAAELEDDAGVGLYDRKDRMLSVWARLLFDETMLEDEGGGGVILTITDEVRRMPGVTDVWCGYVRSGRGGIVIGGEYDDDYDYLCGDIKDDEQSDGEDTDDDESRASRRTLQMQTFGAVRGIERGNDALDEVAIEPVQLVMMIEYQVYAVACVEALLEAKRVELEGTVTEGPARDELEEKMIRLMGTLVEICVFPVGKQAVASAVMHLDAFPTIVSFAAAASPQGPSGVLTRYALEVLEIVLKSPLSISLTLDLRIFELVLPLVPADSALRPWIDPFVAWHARAGVLGVLETLLVHNNKHYTVQETLAEEFLQDVHVVAKILLALRILVRHTYSTGTEAGGMLEVMMSLPEDMNPNGEGLLVFLLKMIKSAADVLVKLVDFSGIDIATEEGVVKEQQQCVAHGENEFSKAMLNSNDTQGQSQLQDKGLGTPTSTSPAGVSQAFPHTQAVVVNTVLLEIVELRRMLLEVVFYEMLLVRRIYRVVYSGSSLEITPSGAASLPSLSPRFRHFRDIFGHQESLDNPLPSQTRSVLRLSMSSLLALASALDRLDWRMSDYFGAYYHGGLAAITEPRAPKTGQTAVIARVRGMLLRVVGELSSIVRVHGGQDGQEDTEGGGRNEMNMDEDDEISGESRHRSHLTTEPKLFSHFAGYRILKDMIDFLLETPENVLSGLQLLQEVLPVMLPVWTDVNDEILDTALQDKPAESSPSSGDHRKMSRDGYDPWSPVLPSTPPLTAKRVRALLQEAIPLREFWLEQMQLIRVDVVRMVQILGSGGAKSVHLALRSLVAQMVDLDHADAGFGREIIKTLLLGLEGALSELKTIFAKDDAEQRGFEDEHQHRVTFKGIEERSVEVEQQMAIVARWLSLLAALDTWTVGKLYLLETVLADEINPLGYQARASSLPNQTQFEQVPRLIPLLLDVMRTIKTAHCAIDLSLEIVYVLINMHVPPEMDDHVLKIADMTVIVDFLLHCICDDERLRTLYLDTLMPLMSTSTGTLVLLNNPQLPRVLGILMDWIPSFLISSTTNLPASPSFEDPTMQHDSRYIINVVYHSLTFIKQIIEHPILHKLPSPDDDHRLEDETVHNDNHITKTRLAQLIHILIEGMDANQHERYDNYNNAVEKLKDIMYDVEQRGDATEITWWNMVYRLLVWFRDDIVTAEPQRNNQTMERFAEAIKEEIEMRLKEVDGQRKQNRRRNLVDLLASVGAVASLAEDHVDFFYDVEDDPYGREDEGNSGLFNVPEDETDIEELAKEILPNFSLSGRLHRAVGTDKAGQAFQVKKGGVNVEPGLKGGKNIGGGKTYQKNEFRSIHNNRKANTSRPPSVHVDDFTKGGGAASTASTGASSTDPSKKPGTTNRRVIDGSPSGQSPASTRGARGGGPGARRVGGAGRGAIGMPRPPIDGMGTWYAKSIDLASAWGVDHMAAATASGIPMQLMGPPSMPKYPPEFDRRVMDDRGDYTQPPPRFELNMRPYFDAPPGFYPSMGPPPPPPIAGPYDRQMQQQQQQRGARGSIGGGSGGPLSPKWPQGPPSQRMPTGIPGMQGGIRTMGVPNDNRTSFRRRKQNFMMDPNQPNVS